MAIQQTLRHGDIVVSLAGRDQGQLLAVVCCDDTGLWLADGKRRPLNRPKRKNRRHIVPAGGALEAAAMMTDRALRRALRQFASDHQTMWEP